MKLSRVWVAFFGGILLCLSAVAISAPPFLSSVFDNRQVEEIQRITEDFLLHQKPGVVEAALKNVIVQKEQQQKLDAQAVIRRNHKALFEDSKSPIVGTPGARTTIVAFMDPQCGFCQRLHDVFGKINKERPGGIRVVYKDFPVLSGSDAASRAGLAAHRQNKYEEFHAAVQEAGNYDERVMMGIAEAIGLDVDRLQKDMESKEIKQIIAKNRKIAEELDINGTPAFIIKDTLYTGFVEAAVLMQLLNEAEEKEAA